MNKFWIKFETFWEILNNFPTFTHFSYLRHESLVIPFAATAYPSHPLNTTYNEPDIQLKFEKCNAWLIFRFWNNVWRVIYSGLVSLFCQDQLSQERLFR